METLMNELLFGDFKAGSILYGATVKAAWVAMPLLLGFAVMYALTTQSGLRGVIGRFILCAILLASMDSVFSGAKEIGMSLGGVMLNSSSNTKSGDFLRSWKKSTKTGFTGLSKKGDPNSWWITNKLNEIKDSFTLPLADEILLRGIWVIVWLILIALRVVYSSVYHFTLIASPLILAIGIIPTFQKGMESLLKTLMWIILVPFILAIIMLAGAEFLSVSDINLHSMSSYLSMAMFAICLGGSVIAATLIVNGQGMHELGNKAGHMLSVGAGMGAARLAWDYGGGQAMKAMGGAALGFAGKAAMGASSGIGNYGRNLQSSISQLAENPIGGFDGKSDSKPPSKQRIMSARIADRVINHKANERASNMRTDFLEANGDAVKEDAIPKHAFINENAYSKFKNDVAAEPSKYLKYANSPEVVNFPSYSDMAVKHGDIGHTKRMARSLSRELKSGSNFDISNAATKYNQQEVDLATRNFTPKKADKYTTSNRANALKVQLSKNNGEGNVQ